MKRPGLLKVSTALVTFMIGVIVSVLAFPPRTFHLVSQDGVYASNLGPSGKGRGMATTSWVSSDGLTVDEVVIGYWSVEEARSEFDLERSRAEQVIELSRRSQRLVARFGPSYRPSFKVITQRQNQISYIESADLEAALEFEKSWLKGLW